MGGNYSDTEHSEFYTAIITKCLFNIRYSFLDKLCRGRDQFSTVVNVLMIAILHRKKVALVFTIKESGVNTRKLFACRNNKVRIIKIDKDIMKIDYLIEAEFISNSFLMFA